MQMDMNEENQNFDNETEAVNERYKARFVLLSEASMVGGCMLAFFGFLTILIRVLFPEGTSLLVDSDGHILADTSWSGDVDLSIDATDGSVDTLFVAEILKIQRRVQHRGANTLTWNDADIGGKVMSNDAVQTFADSTAVMQVNSDSQLTIGENSLIVFDQQEADPFLADSNSVLVMIDGELSGTLSGATKSRFRFGVTLPNSRVTLQPRTPGDDVEFLITVNDDQTTTVNIHKGAAQIVAADGTLKTIGDQQSITIDSTGSDLRVSQLTRAPTPTGPSNNSTVSYRNVPQQIVFTWDAVRNTDRYRILIARDPEFSDRVVDDNVVATKFTHGALGAGTYYWTVRSRVGWSQSEQGAIRRLQVKQDLDPPTLELESPPDTIQVGTWRLRGRTDADAIVFVDEIQVEHENGRIDHPIELQPGANLIVVTAIDDVGNLSYAPLLITAK
jgi:hypothetical protein